MISLISGEKNVGFIVKEQNEWGLPEVGWVGLNTDIDQEYMFSVIRWINFGGLMYNVGLYN